MKKTTGWSLLSVAALVLPVAVIAEAQQPKKVARICYLGNTVSNTEINMKPLRERLREIGYVEGQNITIDYRYWESKVERLPDLAAEFVRLNCDLIVTSGTEAAEAAKNVVRTVPVVMTFGADAVRRGIVASLARPGGNITGLTSIGSELNGKRLELLKEVVPKLSLVGFLWSPIDPDAGHSLKEMEPAARALRLAVQNIEVKGPDDFELAFQAATKARAEALLVGAGGFFAFHQKRVIDLAAKSRLPAMYGNTRYVEAGGLMTYTFDRAAQYRRAAEIVDKILEGDKTR